MPKSILTIRSALIRPNCCRCWMASTPAGLPSSTWGIARILVSSFVASWFETREDALLTMREGRSHPEELTEKSVDGFIKRSGRLRKGRLLGAPYMITDGGEDTGNVSGTLMTEEQTAAAAADRLDSEDIVAK